MTASDPDRLRAPVPQSRRLSALARPDLRSRLARAAWSLAWALLFRPTPVPLHGWRRAVLRAWGARVAAGSHPYPSARIWAPWNLDMGEGSCLGHRVQCYNVAPVVLGPRAIVSQGAHLCTASHDFDDPGFPLTGAPIRLGAGAWVAADAFVGPGVTVGAGAVAVARAVVVRDVAPGDVVGGNPARILRQRGGRPRAG